ncbi:DNA polymerase III subunit delta [Pseudooceanicola onchidii]|uniref:DNA polymerase III subunit delta n=1 Tax=Pseudooceanicola onchidii TaxID=2562279 RepID=UPI0010AAA181|nr:DNA polymerase III subunit delta [Pseudooceanicola onchidii]
MKLSPRDANGYFARPDTDRMGLLIYGMDAMRIALKRQEVIAALVGPKGEEEMRLTRLPAAEVRRDPAILTDAIKAVGFFPGPRVVFVEDANETHAAAILPALDDWRDGDAQVVVTAGNLKKTSSIRKHFENHKNAYAAAIYDNPPTRGEIEAELQRAGLKNLGQEALRDLTALATALDPGDFRQTLEKLVLYKHGDDTPATPEDVAAIAPVTIEAEVDDMLDIVAESRTAEIGPLMQRLRGQGIAPVTLCIGLMRHFRTLYAVAAAPGGPGEGINKVRPPVFGPRRDRILRQAQTWGVHKSQAALTVITETDLALRSAAQTAPAGALVERAMIRLAMMGRR